MAKTISKYVRYWIFLSIFWILPISRSIFFDNIDSIDIFRYNDSVDIFHVQRMTVQKFPIPHETVNCRLKIFGILTQRFRHPLEKRGLVVQSIATIVQIMISNGDTGVCSQLLWVNFALVFFVWLVNKIKRLHMFAYYFCIIKYINCIWKQRNYMTNMLSWKMVHYVDNVMLHNKLIIQISNANCCLSIMYT